MKRIAFALCALILAPLPALATSVMPKPPLPPTMQQMMHQLMPTMISVHGSGTVSQMPNVADITVSINTFDTQATQVTSRNNAIYERIVGALKGLGISSNDLRFGGYNLNYNPPPNPMPKIVPGYEHFGYSLYRSFVIHVSNLALVGKAIDASIGNGATGIGGVNYAVANQSGARNTALARAAADARDQAEAVAKAEGMHLGRIMSVSVDGSVPTYPRPMMMKLATMAAPMASPTQISPSAIHVVEGMSVVYALRP